MSTEIARTRKFTAEEWGQMVKLGIFAEEERLELIEGEIVEMAAIGDPHGRCVSQVNEPLVFGVRRRALVWVNGPVRLGPASVPGPDIVLVRRRSYRSGAPRPEDVLLIINNVSPAAFPDVVIAVADVFA
jgi:hypothetical protein